jgi:hypothetical protein
LYKKTKNPLYSEDNTVQKIHLAKTGFVIAASASFLFSVYLWFTGSREEGLFVGIWVPSILSFGALLLSGKSHG